MNVRCVIPLMFLSVPLLPGCPGSGNPLLGTWVFTINQVMTGIELLPNGDVVVFSVDNNPTLLGSLNWEATGSRFILNQSHAGNSNAYMAAISDGSTMEGVWATWEGPGLGFSGSWFAMKQ